MNKTLIKMHEDASKEYFSIWAKIWKEEKRIPLIVSLINENGRILDVGSRFGDITNEIYKKNKNIVGIDFVPRHIEISKKTYPHINFQLGDVTNIQFENNTFDTVFAGELIEHILDQNNAMKEVFRVLKPNGELVLTTPNQASLRNRIKLLFGHAIETDIVHFNVLTKKQLITLLERNGFVVKLIKGDNIRISKLKLPYLYTNFSDTLIIKAVKKNET